MSEAEWRRRKSFQDGSTVCASLCSRGIFQWQKRKVHAMGRVLASAFEMRFRPRFGGGGRVILPSLRNLLIGRCQCLTACRYIVCCLLSFARIERVDDITDIHCAMREQIVMFLVSSVGVFADGTRLIRGERKTQKKQGAEFGVLPGYTCPSLYEQSIATGILYLLSCFPFAEIILFSIFVRLPATPNHPLLLSPTLSHTKVYLMPQQIPLAN